MESPLFQGRTEGPMVIEGNQDVNNQLKSVIDTNMLVGRNHQIAQVVEFLNDSD